MYNVALRINSKSFKSLLDQTIKAIPYKVHFVEVVDAIDQLIVEVTNHIKKINPEQKTICIEVEPVLASTIYCGLVMWESELKSITNELDIDFSSILKSWNSTFYESCIKVTKKNTINSNVSQGSMWNGLSMN